MRRALILLAAVVSLALAGCGGSGGSKESAKPTGPPLSKAQYQVKLKQIFADVGKSLGTRSSKNTISKADVDDVVTAVHSLADQLAEVNPPTAVAAIHARLVQAMNDLADEFPGIADKLNNAKEPTAALETLFGAHAIKELITVQGEFKAKGYDLNLNS